MDNLKVHHSECIRGPIESAGAKLVFLLLYSPDLSPIELLRKHTRHAPMQN